MALTHCAVTLHAERDLITVTDFNCNFNELFTTLNVTIMSNLVMMISVPLERRRGFFYSCPFKIDMYRSSFI